MTVSVDGSDAIIQLDALIKEFDNIVDDALLEIAEVGQKEAQKRSKGKLSKSIEIEQRSGFLGFGKSLSLVATPEYSSFVEYGRPGFGPKSKQFLKFTINGKTIFTKHVGPMKAQPFMAPAAVLMENVAESIFKKHIRNFI